MKRTTLLIGTARFCFAPIATMELTPITQAATAINAKQFVETAGVAGVDVLLTTSSSRASSAKARTAFGR